MDDIRVLEPAEIAALVQECLALVRQEAHRTDVEVRIDLRATLGVRISLQDLRQVIINLVVNAVHAVEANRGDDRDSLAGSGLARHPHRGPGHRSRGAARCRRPNLPSLLHHQGRGARNRTRTLGQHGSHPPLRWRAHAGVDLRAGQRIPHLGAARAGLRRARQLARPDPGIEPGDAVAPDLARGFARTRPAPRDARALALATLARSAGGHPPVMFM